MLHNKNIIINILLVLWQLPQILLGLLMLVIFRNKTTYTNTYNNITVWQIKHNGLFGSACFSTGPIIITTNDAPERILRHETGHSMQSIYLGFLFHIVISIPSICLFWIRRIFHKDYEWYHSHYPENWADVEGGVLEIK